MISSRTAFRWLPSPLTFSIASSPFETARTSRSLFVRRAATLARTASSAYSIRTVPLSATSTTATCTMCCRIRLDGHSQERLAVLSLAGRGTVCGPKDGVLRLGSIGFKWLRIAILRQEIELLQCHFGGNQSSSSSSDRLMPSTSSICSSTSLSLTSSLRTLSNGWCAHFTARWTR